MSKYLVRTKNSAGDGNGIGWFDAADITTAKSDAVTLFTSAGGITAIDVKVADTSEASYGGYAEQTTLAAIQDVLPSTRYVANKANGQASPTTSEVLIVAANPKRRQVWITNTHATLPVFVGATGLSAVNGFPIMAGQTQKIEWTGAIYGITASSTVVVGYFDEYDT